MRFFLYLVFIFNILMFCLIPSSIYASDSWLSPEEELPAEFDTDKKIDSKNTKVEKEQPSFSSFKVSMKKKKESISFDSEAMKINLKYIENR